MSAPGFLAKARQHAAVAASLFAVISNLGVPLPAAAQESVKHAPATATPIQHVIVIIGENRTFDHVFATYQPKSGETVTNLLSEGIVTSTGARGLNFSLASQSSANDSNADGYQLSPSSNAAYSYLPPVLAGGYTAIAPDPPAMAALILLYRMARSGRRSSARRRSRTSGKPGNMRTGCPATITST
jgi:phospholipase C